MNKTSCTASKCVGTAMAAMLLVTATAAAQTTVTFRSRGTDADAALKALAADFEKQNPDIKIVIQTTSASPDGHIAAVAGGVAPDAAMVNGNQVRSQTRASATTRTRRP